MDFLALNTSIIIPAGTGVTLNDDMGFCIDFFVLGDDQNETNQEFRILFSPQLGDIFDNDMSVVTVIIEEDGDSEC